MRRTPLLIALTMLAASEETWACGHRSRVRTFGYQLVSPASPVVYAPAVVDTPSVAQPVSTVIVPQPIVRQAPATASGTQPSYSYPAEPGATPAYYYTYDSSGKLIVQQWMDWVFRGGREAGLPRPPLPIVGLLRE